MQVRWRKNPKTPDGWVRRTAISLLVGVAGFVFSAPVAFVLVTIYLRKVNPGDMQRLLEAMTSAVMVGLVVAGIGFGLAMVGLWVWGRGHSQGTAQG